MKTFYAGMVLVAVMGLASAEEPPAPNQNIEHEQKKPDSEQKPNPFVGDQKKESTTETRAPLVPPSNGALGTPDDARRVKQNQANSQTQNAKPK